MANISTYRNDGRLSNYPFSEAVLLPFPQSLIRDIKVLRNTDNQHRIVDEPISLVHLSCSNGTVKLTFNNGYNCTVDESASTANVYSHSGAVRGWVISGSVPTDLDINVTCNVMLDPHCVADPCGASTEVDHVAISVNGAEYIIKDVLRISFTGDAVVAPTAAQERGLDTGVVVNCPSVGVDDSLFDYSNVENVSHVTSIAVNGSKVDVPFVDSLSSEMPTLVLDAVWPIQIKDRELNGNGGVLIVGLSGTTDCEECIKET